MSRRTKKQTQQCRGKSVVSYGNEQTYAEYRLILAPLFGWAGIGVLVLTHESSTMVVVINVSRLPGFKSPV